VKGTSQFFIFGIGYMLSIPINDDDQDPQSVEIVAAVQETSQKYESKIRIYRLVSAVFAIAAIGLTVALCVVYIPRHRHDSSSSPFLNGNITVYYAGSLRDILTRIVNPAFTKTYLVNVKAFGAGSGSLVTMLENGNQADVFISADQSYNLALQSKKIPNTKNSYTSWYTFWTRSRLGLGYKVGSRYSHIFEAIRNGSMLWYEALDPSQMVIGRTDPNLDAKGALHIPHILTQIPFFSFISFLSP